MLEKWANINSGSDNQIGLNQMLETLEDAFSILDGKSERVPSNSHYLINDQGEKVEIPVIDCLRIRKRPEAKQQILLGGHFDTVYGLESPFQTTTSLEGNLLKGPGVTDMKGGLLVLLHALKRWESSPYANELGWEVILNPDEEVGSQGSRSLLEEAAKKHTIGIWFEPALPDGSLVSGRKGSLNYTIVARGKSAHAGREFEKGKNAITGLSRFLLQLEEQTNLESGITVNVGKIKGGGPTNIVPDFALARVNIRVRTMEQVEVIESKIDDLLKASTIDLEVHQDSIRKPKICDEKTEKILDSLRECGKEMGIDLKWRETGGASDGNTLAAVGLPNVDTLGVVGNHIHSTDEVVNLDSIPERAELVFRFMEKLAQGKVF